MFGPISACDAHRPNTTNFTVRVAQHATANGIANRMRSLDRSCGSSRRRHANEQTARCGNLRRRTTAIWLVLRQFPHSAAYKPQNTQTKFTQFRLRVERYPSGACRGNSLEKPKKIAEANSVDKPQPCWRMNNVDRGNDNKNLLLVLKSTGLARNCSLTRSPVSVR